MSKIDNRKAIEAAIYHLRGNILDEVWIIRKSSGENYNLQGKTVVMYIKEDTQEAKLVATLTTADGTFTVSGADNHILTFNKKIDLPKTTYKYYIDIIEDDYTLAIGPFYETQK